MPYNAIVVIVTRIPETDGLTVCTSGDYSYYTILIRRDSFSYLVPSMTLPLLSTIVDTTK